MKIYFCFIFLALSLSAASITALADVKLKTRQTISGQTTENTIYIKGKRQRSEHNLGGTQMVTLTQCDLRRSVQLMPQTQMYIVSAWEQDASAPSTVSAAGNGQKEVKKGGVVTTTITTRDTGERRQMFGYTARHLIITTEIESSPDACSFQKKTRMVTDGWYVDAAFALDCDYATSNAYLPKNEKTGCQDRQEIKQIGTAKRGYPLIEKITMFDEGGQESFSMTSEVIELANATLDAALFDIPAGWREAKSQSELYASITGSSLSVTSMSSTEQTSVPTTTGLSSTISTMSAPRTEPDNSGRLAAKKTGTVRIGLAGVKTGAVGEGLNATQLAAVIQNTFIEYLKGTPIEIVPLEAKLSSAIDSEARQKECDYVLYAAVSHKKGGGGFGMFKKIAPVLGNVVPVSGSAATQIAGQVASTAIYTAASMAGDIKSKDELTLDLKVVAITGGTAALNKQFKTKAKSDGDDIISPLVEQAATSLVETLGAK